jgi:hypothetical protein
MRRILVFGLIVSMGLTPVLTAAAPVSDIKARVDLMGTGAPVELKLAGGGKLRGTIGAIEADRFEVVSQRRGAPSREVACTEVLELKLARSTYRSGGTPDVEQARRVVAGLGVGRHVAAKITSGQVFRGNLHTLAGDHFVLQLDGSARLMPITYSSVQNLGPNMSNAVKFSMVGAAAAASAALLVKLAAGDPYRTGRGKDR